MGIDDKYDTHYELIVGEIPQCENNDGNKVNSYRGSYFIVNLHNKKIEFFSKEAKSNRVSCFPTDIEHAFELGLDRCRICEWLSQIDDIDNFIRDANQDYTFSITEQEQRDYIQDV